MNLVIHWFRRDLRLADNTALTAAAQAATRVIPVFILEDALRTGPDVGAARLGFLLKSVDSLRADLHALGYPLVIRSGKSEAEIPKLCRELRAEAVFCNRRYEPYAQARDGRILESLGADGIAFRIFKDAVLWEDRDLLTQAGRPYTVFTPYAKAWKAKRIPAPASGLQAHQQKFPAIQSDPLPVDPAEFGHPLSHPLPTAGEAAARDAFQRFLGQKLIRYHTDRDFPALDGTSGLSIYLRTGSIGIRTIFHQLEALRVKAGDAAGGLEIFEKELIWREFYLQILANFPHVMTGAFRPEYDRLKWSGRDDHFEAWRLGRTGYPLVDASMRCLNQTGWLHNRLRMVAAMFLTKDLLIDWRRGERYFMQKLIDGDMAANNGGWQWSAGTGTDAVPYFRIFNPVSQSKKFDPDGAFIRKWAPELQSAAGGAVHEPWQEASLVGAYPSRTVIHEEQRQKCLAMYQAAAGSRK